MKKQHIILIGIIIVGLGMWWWLGRSRPTPPSEPVEIAAVETQQQAQPKQASRVTPGQAQENQQSTPRQGHPLSAGELEEYGRKAIADQAARRKELERQWKAQWSTPISFYGKVVDQNEVPVAGATIGFEWADAQGEEQHASTTSDGLGLFSLTGIQSRSLNVRVSKAGYSLSRSNQTSFLYADMAGRGTFTTDTANPVLFRLRQRGPGTDLITSQYGVNDYLGVSAPLDGGPVQVDLIGRKTGQGQLVFSQAKPAYENWKQATEWSFHMEIPGGGFIEQNDEFPFEAPETGYQPVVGFNFQKGETNWTTNLSKDYYIRLGDPPRYGRLHLETSIMMSGARLTYAINPDGSRNLEPK